MVRLSAAAFPPAARSGGFPRRKIYEISFTKYFYEYQPLRSLAEIKADILKLQAETEGLLGEILE